MLLGGCHDDHVDQRSRDAHRLRVIDATDCPLDLRDDDAAVVPRRLRDRKDIPDDPLPLHGKIPASVRAGGPDQSDMDREGSVAQPLIAVEFEPLHERFDGACIHAAASIEGVD